MKGEQEDEGSKMGDSGTGKVAEEGRMQTAGGTRSKEADRAAYL